MSKPLADTDLGWNDPRAAEGQLKLVLESLRLLPSATPPYEAFLKIMDTTKVEAGTFLDVGCGVGGYKPLMNRHFPRFAYRGCDASEHMIRLARKHFGSGDPIADALTFHVCDAMDVRGSATIVLASCLIEVLPNWEAVLRHLFTLDFFYLILGRIRVWSSNNRPTEERTYTTIYDTSSLGVIHNWPELTRLIWDAGGVISHIEVYQVDSDSILCSLLCATRVESMYIPWNTNMEEPDVRELTKQLLAR